MKAIVLKTQVSIRCRRFAWEITQDSKEVLAVRGNANTLTIRPEIMWLPRPERPEGGVYVVGYELDGRDPDYAKHLAQAENLDDAIELLKSSLRDRLYYLKDEVQICHDILSRL